MKRKRVCFTKAVGWLAAAVMLLCLAGCGPSSSGSEAGCSAADTGPVNLTVNRLFTDHAVLQRETPVPVFGTGDDGRTVTVTFHGQTKTTTVKDGHWRVNLDAMEASAEGQTMAVTCDGTNITVNDVLVGEVWLASGQSNMVMTVSGLEESVRQEVLQTTDKDIIRIYTVPVQEASAPQEDLPGGSWITSSSTQTPYFSAVGYLFARELQAALNIPVGIVVSAQGGTVLGTWLDTMELVREGLADPATTGIRRNNHYNAMIAPMMPFRFKGILWYQGENNAILEHINPTYKKIFEKYLQTYRSGFENPEMPVLTVQLPVFDEKESNVAWPHFRALQEEISRDLENVHLAVTIDLGDKDDIHPKDKLPIAQRLCLLARYYAYGEDIVCEAPTYVSHTVSGKTVTVEIGHVDQGLYVKGNTILHVKVCDKDGNWIPASCRLNSDGKTLEITSPIASPAGIAYCYENAPTATVFDKNGLPLAPFYVMF